MDYELRQQTARRSDGANPSLVEVHCVTPYGVATNLVKSPYKEDVMAKFLNPTDDMCNACEANIGQYFTSYGNLFMDVMVKLGFNMAAKYMPFIFDPIAHFGASQIAYFDHLAQGKTKKLDVEY